MYSAVQGNACVRQKHYTRDAYATVATFQLRWRNHAPKTETIEFLAMAALPSPAMVSTAPIVSASTVVSTSAMTNNKMPSSKASAVEMMVAVVRAVIKAFVWRRHPDITVATSE